MDGHCARDADSTQRRLSTNISDDIQLRFEWMHYIYCIDIYNDSGGGGGDIIIIIIVVAIVHSLIMPGSLYIVYVHPIQLDMCAATFLLLLFSFLYFALALQLAA